MLNKLIGRNVKFHLAGLVFSGEVLEYDEGYLKINDIKNSNMYVNINLVSNFKEV